MVIFEKAGKANTVECISIAIEKAHELGLPIVAASYTGYTALMLVEAIQRLGFDIPVIVVRGVFGFHEQNAFRMKEETTKKLFDAGVQIVSAAHALSGAERGLSRKFQGVYPVEIIAQTLKMLGQGTKVCVECSTMALNAGLLTYGAPVIAIAGTGGGCDTCMRVTPALSQEILQTKIHEIYCKPNL